MNPLRPMTDAEYATWKAQSLPAYAADKVRSGQWKASESLTRAEEEFSKFLPAGLGTEGHHHFTIQDDAGRCVGAIWIGRAERGAGPIAFVYDLVVWTEHQRQGHAERAMRALEIEVQGMGLAGLALHVFSHNVQAQALYRKLGYVATNVSMFKSVAAASGA